MKKVIIIAFALAMSLQVKAENKAPQTLQVWIQKAFTNFPNIQSARLQEKLAEDYVSFQKGNRLPMIDASASYHYVAPSPTVTLPIGPQGVDLKLFPNNNENVGVEASELLLGFGRVNSQVNKAKAQAETAHLSVQQAEEQLAFELSRLYLNLGFVEESLKVQTANIKVLVETKDLIQSRVDNGTALELDLLNIKVQIENAQNKLYDLQNGEQKILATVAYLTGEEHADLSDEVEDMSWPAQMLPERPESASNWLNNTQIQIAQAKEKIARMDLSAAKSSRLPALYLDGAVGYKNGFVPELDELKFNYRVGLTLKVPIFHGNKVRLQNHMARKKVSVSKLSTKNVITDLSQQWTKLVSEIQTNQAKLQSAQTLIDQAQTALEMAQSQYKNGAITYVDLQNARTALLNAKLASLHQQFNLSNADLEALRLNSTHYWASAE